MTNPTARTRPQGTRDVEGARRFLAVACGAGVSEVEAARAALLSAVRVPEGEPELAPVAARLRHRIDHAAEVLIAARVAPLPPVPPAPPVPDPHADAARRGRPRPDPGWATRAAASGPVPTRRRLRRVAPYAGLGIALVALVVSWLAWASRPPAPVAPKGTQPSAPDRTVTAATHTPTFTERLVAGEIGRADTGLAAPSPETALATMLAAAAAEDSVTVSQALDEQSRLMDVAEIVVTYGAVSPEQVSCRRLGSATHSCYPTAEPDHRAEVVHTGDGWRVRGWIG